MPESTHVARFITPTKNVDKYETTRISPMSKGPIVPRRLSPVTTTTHMCNGHSSPEMYGDDMVYMPVAKIHPPTIMPRLQQPAKTTTDVYVRRRSSPEMYRRDMLITSNAVPRELSVTDRLVRAAKTTTRMSVCHSLCDFHNCDMLHMSKTQTLPLRRTSTV